MKTHTLRHYIYSIAIMFAALMTFTSCDEDELTGYTLVNGHWFGDLDMWYGSEKARGSEISFTPRNSWTNTEGFGVEVDYYRRGSVTHEFEWYVRDGVIYLEFIGDHNLDCIISDYSISSYRFRGYMTPWDSWTGEVFYDDATRFDLRDYDYYWNDYGYSSYIDYGYYTKGEFDNTDSTASTDSTDSTDVKPIEIRGRNRAMRLQ